MAGSKPGQWLLLLIRRAVAGMMLVMVAAACTPTVQMAAPKEPITVNLNVKIQHEIYVKVDKELDEMFTERGLF